MRKKLLHVCSTLLVLFFLCWLLLTGFLYQYARHDNESKSIYADISEGFRRFQSEVLASKKLQPEASRKLTNDGEPLLVRIATDPTMKRLNTKMDFRRKTLSAHCQKLGLEDTPPNPKMKVLYSEPYKLAYCTVPKAGSTNMKKLFWILNGKVTSVDEIERLVNSSDFHRQTSELYQKSSVLLESVDDNYARLLIVRHPFERLLSSYRNKLTPDSKGLIQYANLSQTIREMFGTPQRKKEIGEHASFEEFVDFVTDPDKRNMGHGHDHWLRYDELCSPCSIPYNVIVHLETIDDDMRYLLRLIGAPPEYQFLPGYSKSGVSLTTKKSTIDAIKQLPRQKVIKLYETYKNDFLLFSYSVQDYL